MKTTMEKAKAQVEWYPRQSQVASSTATKTMGKTKFKRGNVGIAYNTSKKKKPYSPKSKRYARSSGSKSQQYDFSRKNKPEIS